MTETKHHVSFLVGHRCFPQASARGHRSWCLYVDVVPKDIKLINQVEFHEHGLLRSSPLAICCTPRRFSDRHSSDWFYRFKTEQETLGEKFMVVRIVAKNGTTAEELHYISFSKNQEQPLSSMALKSKNRTTGRHTIVPVSNRLTFGVELELSDGNGASRGAIANVIQRRTATEVAVVRSYEEAHKPVPTWKLVRDGSIACNRNAPACSKFELVSPILLGEEGLEECYNVLKALSASKSVSISVNKSMGFHVHVSVAGYKLPKLKKICQNFVKYEDGIDALMAPSRRTRGSASNSYCMSCKASIRNPCGTLAQLNGGRHRAIESCTTVEQLCEKMNPEGRYYKLNLQNLVTKRQATIEFRQHAATSNSMKVIAWVRFCVAFVRNSARGEIPVYRRKDFGADEQFDELFQAVIKDPVLEEHFLSRREELGRRKSGSRRPGQIESCCSGCAHGHSCAGAGRGH
ncbi:Putative amidoligase enzyme [Seminavis robusta]|uniref:Amidoligase enzyme n=1 Tax=Seminavis robusta TaxID=568900 RepID=A0A9N8E2N5_9STRA|nr:Putative amidoligase enzyme [Seminavis robusta]|eukprot:Sro483_g152110.1 Putative amidoligase enzyme (461) ;mRNA; f:50267-51649